MIQQKETIRLTYPVPYTAQIASPELAHAIFVEGMDPALDPRWAESGARDPQEYAYWTERACGIACVKMCVEAMGTKPRPLMEWIRAGVERGGYLVEQDARGQPVERGWVHRSMAELIREAGFCAEPRAMTLGEFPQHLQKNRMLIASVSYEVGDDLPVTKKGGHLVVVLGADVAGGRPVNLYINNPSGRSRELQAGARIPVGRFQQGYTGRVILAYPG